MEGDLHSVIPRSGSDRARAFLPVLLLLAIAALSTVRAVTHDQTSWRGISFGMFATYDGPSRDVVATVVRPSGERVRVAIPNDLVEDVRHLETVPSDQAATRLASIVARRLGPGEATRVEVAVVRSSIDITASPAEVRRARIALGVAG